MTIIKRKIKQVLERLSTVHQDSTMENANFEGLARRAPLPKTRKEVTEFIRVVTELWRDSWITHPLCEIIESLAEELERQ